MDTFKISEIQYFITHLLSPFIQLGISSIVVLFCVYGASFNKYISYILNNKNYYVLHRGLFIPIYHTPFGKFVTSLLGLYRKNALIFVLLITITAYAIHIITIELHAYIPPHLLITYKISEQDAMILSKIWIHLPEVTNISELFTNIDSLLHTLTPQWKTPYLNATNTYILIQRICKFNALLVLAINLFHNPFKHKKQVVRSLLVVITIFLIYAASIYPYINAFSYESNLKYRQILEYLEQNNNTIYLDSDIQKYAEKIIYYSNDSFPNFRIVFFK